jgi:hypothetical protein
MAGHDLLDDAFTRMLHDAPPLFVLSSWRNRQFT